MSYLNDGPRRDSPDADVVKCWKNGRLESCTIDEFAQSLRRYAGWADEKCGTLSDPSALLGEQLTAAADLIERLAAATTVPADEPAASKSKGER